MHSAPLIEDVAIELNEARYISKLDLNAAYNQLVLESDSRYITVFATHCGTYRYKRLNFGIKSAAEIFQKTLKGVIQGIRNCRNLSYDIIIHGRTREEHDKTVQSVLKRLKDVG
jgi:hypothetical protein